MAAAYSLRADVEFDEIVTDWAHADSPYTNATGKTASMEALSNQFESGVEPCSPDGGALHHRS